MLAKRIAGIKDWLGERLELSRGGNAQNIRPMEGLRGFAAFIVFLTHYCGFIRPHLSAAFDNGPFRITDQLGNTGVDLFFVLSGYLIYGSLISRPQPFGRYMLRRVQRIYPVFIVVFLVYIPLSFIFPGENKIPGAADDALVYLTANFLLLVPMLVPFDPLVNVTWSLSYEIFFYVLIPLLIVAFGLRKRRPGWRITFFALIAGGYITYCLIFGGKHRLIMFIAGMILFEVLKLTRLRAPSSLLTLVSLLAGWAIFSIIPEGLAAAPLKTMTLFFTYFVLCFHCFFHTDAWLRRAFEWTPLRWFGNMSYSFYMLHALVMQGFLLLLSKFLVPANGDRGALFFWGMMPVLFLAALIPSLVLFLLVERRFSLAPAPKVQTPQERPLPVPTSPRGRRSHAIRVYATKQKSGRPLDKPLS